MVQGFDVRSWLLSSGLRLSSGVPVITIFCTLCVLLAVRVFQVTYLNVSSRVTRMLDVSVVVLLVLMFLFVATRFITLA